MRCLCALLFCLLCCPIWGQQTNDIYDLEFRRCLSPDFSWNVMIFILGEGGCNGGVDSTEMVDGKYPLTFRSLEMMPGSHAYYRFYVRLIQQLYIPGDYQQLEFILNTKCMNIAQGWMKIVALDKNEQYLWQDSVPIHDVGDWSECVLRCQGKGACFWGIEISAAGDCDWSKMTTFAINRMQILGDGAVIDWTKSKPVLAEDDFEYVGLWPESVLPLVKNKRLIALAELVHGDSLIAASERGLIRELVKRDECKLILMELPYDYVLLLELYIQGNLQIREQELLKFAQTLQFDSDFDMAFLNELRAYNRQAEEKVHIVGVDRMTWENCYLFRFWECVTGKKMNTERLAKYIVAGKIIEAIEEFEHNKELTEGWEGINVFWFSMALKQLLQQIDVRNLAGRAIVGRECVMKENIISIVDTFLPPDKQAVLVGHWFHFNKVNNVAPTLEKSCGNYLSQHYGQDYWVVGILKGEGEIWGRIFGSGRKVLHFLKLPRGEEFLENVCARKGGDGFVGKYLSANQVGWLRCCGCFASRIYYMPVVLPQRTDCFLWVK